MFEITITSNNQYGIEIWCQDKSEIDDFMKKRDFLKMAILNNYIESDYYKMKQKANPFLQHCTNDFVVVEFWTDDFDEIEKYVDFLNKKYMKWVLTDMYYYLKDDLTCQDCKYPLVFNEDNGNMSYTASCIVCGEKFQITLIKEKKRK